MIINSKHVGGGGADPVITPLSVNENGTYTAPAGVDGYSPVSVNVQGGGLPEGITELYTGTFTPTENTLVYTITHNLGKYPKIFLCFIEGDVSKGQNYNMLLGFCQYFISNGFASNMNINSVVYTGSSSGNPFADGGAVGIVEGTDENNVSMRGSGTNHGYFRPVVKTIDEGVIPAVYRWIFLA